VNKALDNGPDVVVTSGSSTAGGPVNRRTTVFRFQKNNISSEVHSEPAMNKTSCGNNYRSSKGLAMSVGTSCTTMAAGKITPTEVTKTTDVSKIMTTAMPGVSSMDNISKYIDGCSGGSNSSGENSINKNAGGGGNGSSGGLEPVLRISVPFRNNPLLKHSTNQ
jgi:hypothetical protein